MHASTLPLAPAHAHCRKAPLNDSNSVRAARCACHRYDPTFGGAATYMWAGEEHPASEPIADVANTPGVGMLVDLVNLEARFSPTVVTHMKLTFYGFTIFMPLAIAFSRLGKKWAFRALAALSVIIITAGAMVGSGIYDSFPKGTNPIPGKSTHQAFIWIPVVMVWAMAVGSVFQAFLGPMFEASNNANFALIKAVPTFEGAAGAFLLISLMPQMQMISFIYMYTGISYCEPSKSIFGQAMAHAFAWWIWFLVGVFFLVGVTRITDRTVLDKVNRMEHRLLLVIGTLYGAAEIGGSHAAMELHDWTHPHVLQALNFFTAGAMGVALEAGFPLRVRRQGLPMCWMLFFQAIMYSLHMQPTPVAVLSHRAHAMFLLVAAAGRFNERWDVMGAALIGTRPRPPYRRPPARVLHVTRPLTTPPPVLIRTTCRLPVAAFLLFGAHLGITSIVEAYHISDLHYVLAIWIVAAFTIVWVFIIFAIGKFEVGELVEPLSGAGNYCTSCGCAQAGGEDDEYTQDGVQRKSAPDGKAAYATLAVTADGDEADDEELGQHGNSHSDSHGNGHANGFIEDINVEMADWNGQA